jgi:hypothetical protein
MYFRSEHYLEAETHFADEKLINAGVLSWTSKKEY